MCEWGTSIQVAVFIPADLSSTGEARWTEKPIDSCIAPLVRALNMSGIYTRASCCGHGKRPGIISLTDGRELIIAPDYETARIVGKAFPPIFEQESCVVCGAGPGELHAIIEAVSYRPQARRTSSEEEK